jgi:HEAT repeat protein
MLDSTLRVQKLILRLRASKQLIRLHAGCLLGQMGPAAKDAVPHLLELLHSHDVSDRKLAAWTLGYIGRAAIEAVPALRAATQDDNESVRLLAASALEKIEAPSPAAA